MTRSLPIILWWMLFQSTLALAIDAPFSDLSLRDPEDFAEKAPVKEKQAQPEIPLIKAPIKPEIKANAKYPMSEEGIFLALNKLIVEENSKHSDFRLLLKKIVLPHRISMNEADACVFTFPTFAQEEVNSAHEALNIYGKLQNIVVNCKTVSENLNFTVFVKMNVSRKILVAKRNINKGESLSAASVEEQWSGMENESDESISSLTEVQGLVAKNLLMSGHPIKSLFFEKPLAVKRGEEITILMRSGDILISGKGKALNNGHTGEQIQIMYSASRKIIQGKVAADGTVEVGKW
jgi:flagella basal body P-ring formation protein FlgA